MFIQVGRWPQSLSVISFCIALTCAACAMPTALAQAPEAFEADVGSLTLDAAVELALSHNPSLAALDAQWAALDAAREGAAR